MGMLHTREEIIFLMRGFFALPIITKLGKTGIIDQMLKGEFGIRDIEHVKNIEIFQYVVSYLVQIGLLKSSPINQDKYSVTELGGKVLSRYGSFVLLHSYRTFMDNFESMLFDDKVEIPKCDRLENVIGSGLTNGRKFFPESLKMLENKNINTIIDVGCGDGYFLSRVIEKFNSINVVPIDLSKTAIDQSVKNINSLNANCNVCPIQSDAFDVELWSYELLKHYGKLNKEVVISVWYVVHELSEGRIDRVVKFFKKIHENLPYAQLIIGEITRIDDELLSLNRYQSLMPEFQFFHDVSKQGVLTWKDYQKVLKSIPYTVSNIKVFDPILDCDKVIPTAFIWHLKPMDKL